METVLREEGLDKELVRNYICQESIDSKQYTGQQAWETGQRVEMNDYRQWAGEEEQQTVEAGWTGSKGLDGKNGRIQERIDI